MNKKKLEKKEERFIISLISNIYGKKNCKLVLEYYNFTTAIKYDYTLISKNKLKEKVFNLFLKKDNNTHVYYILPNVSHLLYLYILKNDLTKELYEYIKNRDSIFHSSTLFIRKDKNEFTFNFSKFFKEHLKTLQNIKNRITWHHTLITQNLL